MDTLHRQTLTMKKSVMVIVILAALVVFEVSAKVVCEKKCWKSSPGRQGELCCGGLCRCLEDSQTVCCNNRNLTEVPKELPNNSKYLCLHGNKIRTIRKISFGNTSGVLHMDLQDNSISDIEVDSFSATPKLTVLILNNNPLSLGVLMRSVFCGLNTTEISELNVRNVSIDAKRGIFPDNLTCLTGLHHLNSFDFSYNQGLKLTKNLFAPLGAISSLSLVGLHPKAFTTLAFTNLTSLVSLALDNNSLESVPNFYSDNSSVLPSLSSLSLNYNRIDHIKPLDFMGLRNVEYLYLAFCRIENIPDRVFRYLYSIRKVMLDNNNIREIHEYGLASPTLESFNLQNNQFVFRWQHRNIFRQAPRLSYLTLQRNNLDYLGTKAGLMEQLFQNLSQLTELDLSYIHRITTIKRDTFRNLYNLTTLRLQGNYLTEIVPDLFLDLLSLQKLSLNGNQFEVFNSTTFPKHLNNLREINLAGNPFRCTCELLWFRHWLNSTNIRVQELNRQSYRCHSPPSMNHVPLLDYRPTPELCLSVPLSAHNIAAIVLSLLYAVTLILASLVYRYRWWFRYTYFNLTLKLLSKKEPAVTASSDDNDFEFDAFISFNLEDYNWVQYYLQLELEVKTEPAFRLCLSGQDAQSRFLDIEQFVSNMERSYKTVLIVTNEYARCEWCMLEMTLAQHRLFQQDRDDVVLAVMEDIDPLNLTPRLALEMLRKEHLVWTYEEPGQALFWQKLKRALRERPSSPTRRLPPNALVQRFAQDTT